MSARLETLTDKEKETLRLMARGHDAKSMARELDRSVHTINDRLRAARRKLEVTSSREAARLLFDEEGGTPENLTHAPLGDAAGGCTGEIADMPARGRPAAARVAVPIAGVIAMSLILAVALGGQAAMAPSDDQPTGMEQAQVAAAAAAASDTQSVNAQTLSAARDWLALVDAYDWQASFEAAGKGFRDVNTPEVWAKASREARQWRGKVLSRELVGQRYVAAPPAGYQEVTFRTRFENGGEATETLTLEKEQAGWRVVGVLIE